MTPAMIKSLKRIGPRVEIRWKSDCDDWPYFEIVEVCAADKTLQLRGADYPDGTAKHDGDSFWVDWDDIKSICSIVGPQA